MSENIIYYYTGTGNSLSVAKTLAEKLGNTDIIRMDKNVVQNPVYGIKRIGFVYPVFASGLPLGAHKFIEMLKIKKEIYYFSIAVCGALPGDSHGEVNRILQNKGIEISYFKTIRHVISNILLVSTKRNDSLSLAKIQAHVNTAANNIYECRVTGSPANHIFFKQVHKLYHFAPKFSAIIKVNDKCLGCKVCSRLCPTYNIEIINNRPVHGNQCELCLACVQFCPCSAVDVTCLSKHRKRYHNKDVSIEELLRKKL